MSRLTVRTTSEGKPGSAHQANVILEESKFFAWIGEGKIADNCEQGLFDVGIDITLSILVDGERQDSVKECMDGQQSFNLSYILPEQTGNTNITVEARGTSSNYLYAQNQKIVQVKEDATPTNPGNETGIQPLRAIEKLLGLKEGQGKFVAAAIGVLVVAAILI